MYRRGSRDGAFMHPGGVAIGNLQIQRSRITTKMGWYDNRNMCIHSPQYTCDSPEWQPRRRVGVAIETCASISAEYKLAPIVNNEFFWALHPPLELRPPSLHFQAFYSSITIHTTCPKNSFKLQSSYTMSFYPSVSTGGENKPGHCEDPTVGVIGLPLFFVVLGSENSQVCLSWVEIFTCGSFLYPNVLCYIGEWNLHVDRMYIHVDRMYIHVWVAVPCHRVPTG